MSNKQPNRLATLIDHQAFAGSALPQTLADNMRWYLQITDEVKTLLAECLPEEILTTCFVVGFTDEQLVISVNSLTAANHIRYLQNAYLKVLKEQSITFKQLKQISVVVTQNTAKNKSFFTSSQSSTSSKKTCEANNNQALSPNTKRTIAQAAEHVTADEKLKKAIMRLLDE